ncbi:hypothetical protein BK125_04770 [Paenibacillus odorifer]|uniref:Uncharacterized protein n=1 Tax=Paenibacillus odorifer TaxID=189426 RepID=A0ABX3GTI1_9BACL|nr:hypothetical protein [Paenibacillus odorifer]OMC79596.1 hypothetical protein BK125_04770 [Paenibacillus odorifer]OMD34942.1 hypothetical protein BSO21_10015 [Paenibacillus odorifer]
MAILKTIELDSGINVKNAYARVDNRSGGNKTNLTFALSYYINQQAFEEGKSLVKQEYFTFESSVADDAPNDIKQCYEYLKSLEEFEHAIDVLE